MRNVNPVNPDQKDIHDLIDLSGGLIAHRYSILGTPFLGYRVWEPTDEIGMCGHREKFRIGRTWYGNITSRQLPASLEALPAMSEARFLAVQTWRKDLEGWEERLLRATFPEDFEDFVETEEEMGAAV